MLQKLGHFKIKSNKGFTLAEVLLVITIIGIIASYTIPGLINDIKEQQYKITLKKTFSELSQVTKSIMEENNGTTEDLCKLPYTQCTTAAGKARAFAGTIKSYMQYAKYCDWGTAMGDCWFVGDITYLNGTTAANPASSTGAGIVLNNGVTILTGDYYYSYPYGSITVDVNGFKGPNQYGKDIFKFKMDPTQLLPRGYDGDTVGCDKTSAISTKYKGEGCSYKVLTGTDY